MDLEGTVTRPSASHIDDDNGGAQGVLVAVAVVAQPSAAARGLLIVFEGR